MTSEPTNHEPWSTASDEGQAVEDMSGVNSLPSTSPLKSQNVGEIPAENPGNPDPDLVLDSSTLEPLNDLDDLDDADLQEVADLAKVAAIPRWKINFDLADDEESSDLTSGLTEKAVEEVGREVCEELLSEVMAKIVDQVTVGPILEQILKNVFKDIEDFELTRKKNYEDDLDLKLSEDDEDSDGYEPTFKADENANEPAKVPIHRFQFHNFT